VRITETLVWTLFAIAALFCISCSDKGTDSQHLAPFAATTPYPADSAIGQAVMPHLSWRHESLSYNDSVTFNVYFSSEHVPGLAASGLTERVFSPGKLQYNTMYYWKVEACDRYGGRTMGPLWRFTTSVTNQAPDPVTGPSPSNDTVNQPLSVLLGWQASDPDGDSLHYDVYFGVDENPPLVATGQPLTSYLVSGLENHTVYHWRIVSHDDFGHETSGPIWMFTTLHTIGHIVPVGSYPGIGTFTAVFASGNHVYVATGDCNLLVFDVSHPESPSLVAELEPGTRYGRDVFVLGDYAYLAAWSSLQVVDISDPMRPSVVGACQDVGVSVYVEGGYAYCSLDGLNIVNISDPYHPTLSGMYAGLYGSRIVVRGDYAFSLNIVGFYVFDVHNKSAPELIAWYQDLNHDTQLRRAVGIDLSGQYAFVVGTEEHDRFRIVDISDPANPTMVTWSDIAGGQAVEVSGDYAFVGDGRTLLAIDVSDISAPVIVGAYDAPSGITDLFVTGEYVFVGTDSSGLLVFRFVP
jgi:hypothetical protein